MIITYEGVRKGKLVKFEIDDIGERFWMERHAAAAFNAMRDAARADGIVLKVNTALRTHDWQKRAFARYVIDLAEYENGKRDKKPAKVARPGYSNHETGLAVDVNRAHDDTANNGIADGKTDKWLDANAARFGFVKDVDGEPWHLHFVGCDAYPVAP